MGTGVRRWFSPPRGLGLRPKSKTFITVRRRQSDAEHPAFDSGYASSLEYLIPPAMARGVLGNRYVVHRS